MNLETFMQAVEIMVEALPSQGQERRVRALFEFFGERDFQQVREAARCCARELDRFPAPATFGQFMDRSRSRGGTEERQACGLCDGYGWVMVDGLAHRGRCAHGQKLARDIKTVPESYRNPIVPRPKDEAEFLATIKDPRITFRGILALTGGKYDAAEMARHAKPLQRIWKGCMDLLGENEAKKIAGSFLNQRKMDFSQVVQRAK